MDKHTGAFIPMLMAVFHSIHFQIRQIMTSTSLKILLCFLLTIYFGNVTKAQTDIQYDIVLAGGRVIDPETKLV
jgi:hypothetical protein